MTDNALRISLYLCSVLSLILAVISITGVFKINFIWVTSPLWIPLSIYIIFSSVALLVAGLIDSINSIKKG